MKRISFTQFTYKHHLKCRLTTTHNMVYIDLADLHGQGLGSLSIHEEYGELEQEWAGDGCGMIWPSCSGKSRMLLTEKLNFVEAAMTSGGNRILLRKTIQINHERMPWDNSRVSTQEIARRTLSNTT